MPPRRYSRYSFTEATVDDTGALLLSDPEPYLFRDFNDNIIHTVVEGDTLFSLAGRHFSGMPRPAGLYWIIADFQPDPILDPTLKLQPGAILFIPSLRTVTEEIFSEKRRDEESA